MKARYPDACTPRERTELILGETRRNGGERVRNEGHDGAPPMGKLPMYFVLGDLVRRPPPWVP